jgi:Tfp pilus assembly protein PilP
MMRRHFISIVTGGSLMIFLLAGGAGERGIPFGKMSLLHAADTSQKGVPTPPPPPLAAPAAPPGVSGGPATAPVAVAALPPSPPFQYNAAGKADPFRPFIEMDPALKKRMEEEEQKKRAVVKARPISPLQQADIGQFRLLGIAGDENRRVAIVEDGVAKKFYPLFVGTYIGTNEGRVSAILPDRLVVEEPLETQDKKTKQVKVRQIPVLLHKEQEEGK